MLDTWFYQHIINTYYFVVFVLFVGIALPAYIIFFKIDK